MRLKVVLVEPIYEGNVGSIARVMKNFGFSDLALVNPCTLGNFGRAMASHAKDLLEEAEIFDRLEEAIKDANLVVGSSGVKALKTDEHLRVPALSPSKLAAKLMEMKGTVALLLGREDNGLSREELRVCDMIVTVPTSQDYPIMNISHAAAVILYELSHVDEGEITLAARECRDRLNDHLRSALVESQYYPHKLEKTMLMLRRILGRAELTDREVQTLHGVIRSLRWRAKGSGE